MENNTTCKICGKGYYICMSCKSHKLTPWKTYTDTPEHYKIFQVIHGYSTGVYDKTEAKQRLENIDLSDLKELRENIQLVIKEIMSDKKDTKRKTGKQDVEEKEKDIKSNSTSIKRRKV